MKWIKYKDDLINVNHIQSIKFSRASDKIKSREYGKQIKKEYKLKFGRDIGLSKEIPEIDTIFSNIKIFIEGYTTEYIEIISKNESYIVELMKDISDFLSNEQDVILTILPENI